MKRDSPATARLKRAERTARAAAIIRRDPDTSASALATELGVSPATAYKLRLAVEELYERRAVDARDKQIGRQLMAYYRVIEQAEEGLIKSADPLTEHTVSEEGPAARDGDNTPGRIRKTVRKMTGRLDARFLGVKMGALARIDSILGLDAPSKASITISGYNIHAVVQEFANLAVRELSALKAPDAVLGRMVSGCNEILARAIGATPGAAAKGIIGPAVRDADEIEVEPDGEPDGDGEDLGDDDGLDELADPDWGE